MPYLNCRTDLYVEESAKTHFSCLLFQIYGTTTTMLMLRCCGINIKYVVYEGNHFMIPYSVAQCLVKPELADSNTVFPSRSDKTLNRGPVSI